MQAVANAEQLVEAGRWQEAVAILGPVVATEPRSFRSRCLLAEALVGLGRYGEAQRHAEEAVSINPGRERPHRLRSRALTGAGDHEGAAAEARLAVRLEPLILSTHVLLADCEARLKHWSAAEEAAKAGVELSSDRPDAHAALGRIAFARRRYVQAEQHFRDALRRTQGDDWALTAQLDTAVARQRGWHRQVPPGLDRVIRIVLGAVLLIAAAVFQVARDQGSEPVSTEGAPPDWVVYGLFILMVIAFVVYFRRVAKRRRS